MRALCPNRILLMVAMVVAMGAVAPLYNLSIGKDREIKEKAKPSEKPSKKPSELSKSKDLNPKTKGEPEKQEKAPKDQANQKVESNVTCPAKLPPIPDIKREDVYKNTPYKQGEKAEYEVRYMGALAGTGVLEVKRPFKFQGAYKSAVWHRNFHAEAKTGDWYKLIFVAHDKLDALVRPWDWGVSRFYLEQDEGKMFGNRLQQMKWLEFDHDKCKVHERRVKKGKKDKNETFELAYGAMDTLGIAYWLREQDYKLGKKVRSLVYSSENNWWLEATPVLMEETTVKAGKFNTAKLKLQTYIGEELQQKGDVNVWIATDHPQRPLIKVEAEIKVGSVTIDLSKFEPGK